MLRGVEFSSTMLDDFEPHEHARPEQLASFTFYGRQLCACVLECDIPIALQAPTGRSTAMLSVRLELGEPLAQRLEREVVQLGLSFQEQTVRSREHQYFEDALLDIQRKLPEDTFMVICHSCAFSDYHPVGAAFFGGLACFRSCKDAYRKIASKADFFDLWDKKEFVQETHFCPEFERRKPGNGYRG